MPANVRRTRIARALAYPYDRPSAPYVYFKGKAWSWSAESLRLCRSPSLTPVLAVGSNASPEQLFRKFGHIEALAIPVTCGYLHGHDVVYAAYMTAYGSVPATLIASAGCSVRIAVTWLDDATLDLMHQSEAVGVRTRYGRLEGLRCDGPLLYPPNPPVSGGLARALSTAFTYQSLTGTLAIDEAPVALAELSARGRRLTSLTQQGLQRRLRRWLEAERLGAGEPADPDFASWVDENTRCQARRARINRWLEQHRRDHPLAGFFDAATPGGSE